MITDQARPILAERILLGLLLGAVGLGCAVVLRPFLSAIFWAAILVFSTWPVFTWLRSQARLGGVLASAVMVLLTSVLVVLPLAVAAPSGADDVARLQQQWHAWFGNGLPAAPAWIARLPVIGPVLLKTWNAWSDDLNAMAAFFRPYLGVIAENGFGLLIGIAGGILNFLLALFIAFFFWVSGDALASHVQGLLRRVCGPQADRLIAITGNTVRGTVYGILGTAIVQGVLTGAGLWLTGVPSPLLLGSLAGLLSVLPIGAPIVWVPAVFWLLLSGHTGGGIFLATYGVLAISGADNLIRPYFIARGAKLPFLLTAIGVLGGALAFGLLGIFLGPVLLGVGFTLAVEFARPASARHSSALQQSQM